MAKRKKKEEKKFDDAAEHELGWLRVAAQHVPLRPIEFRWVAKMPEKKGGPIEMTRQKYACVPFELFVELVHDAVVGSEIRAMQEKNAVKKANKKPKKTMDAAALRAKRIKDRENEFSGTGIDDEAVMRGP